MALPSDSQLIAPAHECCSSFEQVCELLQKGHRVGNDTPEQTLNRLFRKHLNGLQKDIADNPPWLSASNTAIVTELWPKPKLRDLARREQSRKPAYLNLPVVIVRYRDRNCLIDGGSRIHHWFLAGEDDDHPACVIVFSESGIGS